MYMSKDKVTGLPYAKEVTNILELHDVNFDVEVSMELQQDNVFDL